MNDSSNKEKISEKEKVELFKWLKEVQKKPSNVDWAKLHVEGLKKVGKEESKIEKYKNDIKDLPLWLRYVGVGATVFGAIFGGWGIYIILNQSVPSQMILNNPTSENATSTINISDLLSKALALDTVIERQDFLTKYVGDLVYGKGEIKQVSRYGNKLLVDFDINDQTIICPQDEDTKNEKQLLLLKGKTASFSGIFTYTEYFNYKGLVIDDCILQR